MRIMAWRLGENGLFWMRRHISPCCRTPVSWDFAPISEAGDTITTRGDSGFSLEDCASLAGDCRQAIVEESFQSNTPTARGRRRRDTLCSALIQIRKGMHVQRSKSNNGSTVHNSCHCQERLPATRSDRAAGQRHAMRCFSSCLALHYFMPCGFATELVLLPPQQFGSVMFRLICLTFLTVTLSQLHCTPRPSRTRCSTRTQDTNKVWEILSLPR